MWKPPYIWRLYSRDSLGSLFGNFGHFHNLYPPYYIRIIEANYYYEINALWYLETHQTADQESHEHNWPFLPDEACYDTAEKDLI